MLRIQIHLIKYVILWLLKWDEVFQITQSPKYFFISNNFPSVASLCLSFILNFKTKTKKEKEKEPMKSFF